MSSFFLRNKGPSRDKKGRKPKTDSKVLSPPFQHAVVIARAFCMKSSQRHGKVKGQSSEVRGKVKSKSRLDEEIASDSEK